MRPCALLLALALTGCATLDKPQLAIIATSTADIVTTEVLLSRGGYAEGNPLLKDQAIRLAAKAAVTGATLHLYRKYKAAGEHEKAKWVAIIATVVWGAAFTWNAQHLK